ncbi:MAG: xanthine dehydrogenase family protein subunit M [Chloroflexota bacterium]
MIFYRRLPHFEYLAPHTIEGAISALREQPEATRVIAGGTDLLLEMRRRDVTPERLLGLSNIPGIDYLKYGETDGLRLGAMATLSAVEKSPLVREKYPVLFQAVHGMASEQVRNIATVTGNLCTALPSADTAPALLVLDATLEITGPGGKRVVAIADFFKDYRRTALEKGEILTGIRLPAANGSRGVYLKHRLRKAMSLPVAGVAVLLKEEGGVCRDVRIALGAVAPSPIRAVGAEDWLRGAKLTKAAILEAARLAAEAASPISDIRASAEYRRELVAVFTRRALAQLSGREALS